MQLFDNGAGYQFFGLNYQAGAHGDAYLSDVYKMMIDVSGAPPRVFVFRDAGCRKRMLECYDDYLDKAGQSAEIKRIRVWGTVGNQTDIVLEWVTE